MNSTPHYQIFISSTYEDLREERQQATQAILEIGHFPSGMELFPASDSSQWELIKNVIKESDYYIVIVGGRYGNIGTNGLSYTEMEYDYAIEQGIPVLGFVRENTGDISNSRSEISDEGKKRLVAFRNKVLSKLCRRYNSPAELGLAVMKSLVSEMRINPRNGWVRGDQARSNEDIQRERKLTTDLENAISEIADLKREIRDRIIVSDVVDHRDLAQENDLFEFRVGFKDNEKRHVVEGVMLSWNDVFNVIGPSMYGYIVRKYGRYGAAQQYNFQAHIEELIRSKIIDKIQGMAMSIDGSQIDTCIIQLKELGLIQFAENTDKEGETFRGVTLTEAGERKLVLQRIQTRKPEGRSGPS